MALILPPSDARSILQLAQAFSRKYAQSVPGGLFGSRDAGVLQILELLQEVGDFCSTEVAWKWQERLVTWTAPGTEAQGQFPTLFPDSFESVLHGTFYNRSEQEEVLGPLSPAEWQSFQAHGTSVRSLSYESGGVLYISPAPTLGQTLALTYRSTQWLVGADNMTKSLITADDDVPLVPRALMDLGLLYYWKRLKELPYALEEGRFMDKLYATASGRGVQQVLSMGGTQLESRPQIVLPRRI